MIPKRYYLTLMSMVPILCAQLFIAYTTWANARTRASSLRRWRIGVAVLGTLVLTGMLSSFGFTEGLPRTPVLALQTVVNLWGLVSLAAAIAYLISKWLIGRLPEKFQQDRRDALRMLAGAAVVSPALAVGFGTFIERTNFEVCERTIAVRGLPRDLEGLRLLQLSDIHIGPFLSARTLERVIGQANELKPHLALVTGDLISVARDPLDECLDLLARLRADHGILGCLGNHETYANVEAYTTAEGHRRGIDFLRGQARLIKIGDSMINIAGVDYQPFERRSNYLSGAGALLAPGAVNLLLSHNPDVFPVAAAHGFDLMLAGHTHGGQVTMEILSPALNPARMVTPFVRGLYFQGNSSCYVTRGIGTLGVPTRLGARPEITLLSLKRLV